MNRRRLMHWTCRNCQTKWVDVLGGRTGTDDDHHITLCERCLDRLQVRRVCGVLRLVYRDEC
jgi:hypothetical protein